MTRCALLFGLASSGVCPAINVATDAVRSYRHHFTLTTVSRESRLLTEVVKKFCGGIFSVALSVGSRLPDVIWHSVL